MHIHEKTDKVDQIRKKNIPGPGNYDIINSIDGKNETSPKFKIGSMTRPALGGTREQKMKPGPGSYSQTIDFKKDAPQFSIGKQER